MTSYAKLRWDIITEWNSDAKYTNTHLTDLSTSLGVDIGDKNADRKSIVAQVADVVIKSGIDNGEYNVTDWGAFTQEQGADFWRLAGPRWKFGWNRCLHCSQSIDSTDTGSEFRRLLRE